MTNTKTRHTIKRRKMKNRRKLKEHAQILLQERRQNAIDIARGPLCKRNSSMNQVFDIPCIRHTDHLAE